MRFIFFIFMTIKMTVPCFGQTKYLRHDQFSVSGGTVSISAWPMAENKAGAMRCVNVAGNAFESCGGTAGGLTDTQLRASAISVSLPTASPSIVSSSNTLILKSSSFSITGTTTIIPGVTNKRLRIYAISYISGSVASVNFRDGANDNLEGPFAHIANAGRVENINPPYWRWQTSPGNRLDMVYSGLGTVAGSVSYWEE